MEKQPPIQKTQKKSGKKVMVLIIIVLIILATLSWAGLTRAGFIENYLHLNFLSDEHYVQDNDFPIGDAEGFGKPVIYLYPQQKQHVKVRLDFQGDLAASYPAYNNGWDVIASPTGEIINLSDNKKYSYLFWEGTGKNANYDLSSGFVVKGSETAQFLQEKLAALGLTPKEYNEFIVYWLPQMQNSRFNLIHFATKEEYDDKVVLDINPKPDSVLRVFMAFKKIDGNIGIKPQEIKAFERNGFTVIEWGGTEIK